MTNALFRPILPPTPPLFDVHVNALSPGAAPTRGFYATQGVEVIAKLGVSRALVSPPALPGYAAPNAALRAWSGGTGGRFLAMARLGGATGPHPINGLWQARRAVRAALRKRPSDIDTFVGFAAVKLMPHVDGLPAPDVLADINRHKLPVLVHAGAMCPPRWLARRLLPHLEGPMILAHLGAWPCAAEALSDAVDLAVADPRVYLETSGASIGNFIAYAAKKAPTKVLFGSNVPMCPPLVQWAHVAASVVDDAVLEGIAWRNAHDLFGPADADRRNEGGDVA